ncbi:hydrolase 76 protein [Rhizoclosmatium sp. JEL0117]|nr:hydrolase 76 protein [Rhizoclosmatium sp. JEL0117]
MSMWPLKMFFDANTEGLGAWYETYQNPSKTLIQWHESGIYWGMFYDYYGLTGDSQFNDWSDGQMQLAVGPNVGFLDAISAQTGRWNDDIGWWGLSVMSAAEATKDGIIAPRNPVDGQNPKYIDVVNNTYFQMLDEWDDSCGGGIFWSRDRTTKKVNDAYYKSSITNAQHIEMGARLYAYTKNQVYKDYVDRIYTWMKSSSLIDPTTYAVSDGLDSRSCTLSTDYFSYHSGVLISGLAHMFKATGDTTYLQEAHKHFARIVSYFTINNVLYDPSRGSAPLMPNGFLWPVYRSIGVLYSITTDDSVKASIRTVMSASAAFNFQPCNSIWYCIRDLDPSKFKFFLLFFFVFVLVIDLDSGTDRTLWNGTSPRDQFEVVSILNALVVITGTPVVQHVQDKTPIQTGSDGNPVASTGNSKLAMYMGIGFGCAALILIVLIVLVVVQRNKAMKQGAVGGGVGVGGTRVQPGMAYSGSKEKLVDARSVGAVSRGSDRSGDSLGRGVPRGRDEVGRAGSAAGRNPSVGRGGAGAGSPNYPSERERRNDGGRGGRGGAGGRDQSRSRN